jgi:RecQ family ATP-dependent DNA helicase
MCLESIPFAILCAGKRKRSHVYPRSLDLANGYFFYSRRFAQIRASQLEGARQKLPFFCQKMLALALLQTKQTKLDNTLRLSLAPVDTLATTIMNDDEFGDASFLEGFNVDEAVQSHYSSTSTSTSTTSTTPANKRLKVTPSSSPDKKEALVATLERYFGYKDFREGQLEVIQAILERRDVAVFWATGKGKSLCYQIPALYLNQTVIVVSPLISLMQDQVHKLNGLVDKPLATFLGSGQTDQSMEQRALDGEFLLVYLTPEKLTSDRFISQLSALHSKRPIALVAIDEAHCVSEWGHDFRKQFRQVGPTISSNLPGVPVLALTATAIPRVQRDIVQSLHLRSPLQAIQSFDRMNLAISVKNKASFAQSFKSLIATLNNSNARFSQQSTIVYCPTRNLVEQVASFLQGNVGCEVQAYHAGLGQEHRDLAHTNFLTGQTTIIVATVAFGMGIDKPDTRRVIHYGAPKTMEEYYQQIGRAGRDGLPAECTMYAQVNDFERYQSDFYLKDLQGPALEATKASMRALRDYALSESCRRKTILQYFGEVPSFDQCGTCDCCSKGEDSHRDFGKPARIILHAIDHLKDPSSSILQKVLGGGTVEDYRYLKGSAASLQRSIEIMRKDIDSKLFPRDAYRELLTSLVQNGFLAQLTKKAEVNGFERSWQVYSLPTKGRDALKDSSSRVLLAVPDIVREAELKEEERRQRILAQLEKAGISKDKLPAEEVEKGDGPVIRAYDKWYSYLEKNHTSGRDERVSQLQALMASIETWRSEMAVKHRMSPGAVLPEHLLAAVAYATATLPNGATMDSNSLLAAGVRSKELDSLTSALGRWLDEYQPAAVATGETQKLMVSCDLNGIERWEHAVYKPGRKKGSLPAWEYSYNRFCKGESPQTIAMTQTDGKKPIQCKTVVRHILESVVHGKASDLSGLFALMPPPTKSGWEDFEKAEAASGMNVQGDPDSSGKDGEKFSKLDLLRPIVGDDFMDKRNEDRSEEDKAKLAWWYDKMEWYFCLKRVGVMPKFQG